MQSIGHILELFAENIKYTKYSTDIDYCTWFLFTVHAGHDAGVQQIIYCF